jgi:predicted anti-sigma-YlaC factor YlaD
MDCAKSLELLSEFRDGALSEADKAFVSAHLALCPPCMGIFKDIDSIVIAAAGFVAEDGIAYPDENVFWQRISVTKRTVH